MKYNFSRKKWEIMHSLLFISHAMGLHRKTYVRAAEDLDASSDAVWSTVWSREERKKLQIV